MKVNADDARAVAKWMRVEADELRKRARRECPVTGRRMRALADRIDRVARVLTTSPKPPAAAPPADADAA